MIAPDRWSFRVFACLGLSTLAVGLGGLGGAGCDTPLPGDEVCKDVGYAIANKIFECKGDIEEANTAYERFQGTHTCKVTDLPSEGAILDGRIDDPPRDVVGDQYACSAAILQLPCERANTIGGDYDAFLAATPLCDAVFGRTGNATIGGAGGAGGAGAGGAGNVDPGGPRTATMSLNVLWDDTSISGPCIPNGPSFTYECVLQNNEREARMTVQIERFRPATLQGPPLLQGVVSLRLQLQGPTGTFVYDPQQHPDDRPFDFSLVDDMPTNKTARSFTLSFAFRHDPATADFPFFVASGNLVARNQPCPSADACP